jgi:hypothetical protein
MVRMFTLSFAPLGEHLFLFMRKILRRHGKEAAGSYCTEKRKQTAGYHTVRGEEKGRKNDV